MEETFQELDEGQKRLDLKLKRLVWTPEETQIVGRFLMGQEIETVIGENRKELWNEVKASTTIEPEEAGRF